jgi:hypothetical protein
LNTATGAINGMPTAAGPFSFTAQITDAIGVTAAQAYSVTIVSGAAPLQITTGPVAGFQGYTYAATILTATGGVPPYTWSGASLTGMNLTSTGVLTGYPSVAGTASVTVTDGGGAATSASFTIYPSVLTLGSGTQAVTVVSNVNLAGGPSGPVQVNAQPTAAVPLSFSYSLTEASCPGCQDQLVFGFTNAPPTSCIDAGQPGMIGASGGYSASMIAPATPGRYYVAFHKSQTTSCSAALAAGWANGTSMAGASDPIIGVVDVIPASQTFDTVTLSAINVSSTGTNNALVPLPGPPGVPATFTVGLSYSIYDAVCPGCVDLIQVGIASGPPQNSACPYGPGIPGAAGAFGANTVTLTTPAVPGRYYIGFDREQDFQCNSSWWSGNPDFSRVVAVVDVVPTA